MASENFQEKVRLVESMRRDVARSAAVLFLDYTHLTVSEADGLRKKMRAANIEYRVTKNTLMAKAIEGTPYASAAQLLKGAPTGVVLGFEDPVNAAKVAFEYSKECEHVKVKGGILDNRAITPQEAEALSKMPSKAEMQASLIALALGPGRRLAAQIKNPAGKIVGAIEALVKRQEENHVQA